MPSSCGKSTMAACSQALLQIAELSMRAQALAIFHAQPLLEGQPPGDVVGTLGCGVLAPGVAALVTVPVCTRLDVPPVASPAAATAAGLAPAAARDGSVTAMDAAPAELESARPAGA